MGRLAEAVLRGDVRAAARLMRLLDDRVPEALAELKELHPHTGRAYVVGVTGSPGAGKSTLTDRIVAELRQRDLRVGVVAIDPTSPFSGGAILGDRIRMQRHEGDPEVFVRSLATRGNLGGLSRSTRDVIRVMDAMGKDVVIVETVGVGQDEVDIVGTADTSLVVLVPGMGDDIQAIKAGILEIADIFVINKADREGVERTEREIRLMLELGGRAEAQGWRPPIVRTVATRGEGIAELVDRMFEHRAWLTESGQLAERRRRAALAAFWDALDERLRQRVGTVLSAPEYQEVRAGLESGELDPYVAAETIGRAVGVG